MAAPPPGKWPSSEVDGKVALIHGGSEGQGLAFAREFTSRGCRVVLIGKSLPRSAAGSAGGESSDASVRLVELDHGAGEEAYGRAVDAAWGVFGSVSVLVNCNSGPATMKPFLETTDEEFDGIMDVNVKASWRMGKAVARKMREAGTGGSIIFITSITGTERGIYPGVSMYGTSMAAVHHLTKMMAMEVGKYGIRVNAVSCGLTPSDSIFESKDTKSVQEMAKKVVPLQRWSKFPGDIMGVVLWLAGDSSTFVTGTISIADGGQSITRARLSSFL
ncbi:hypothetical protein MPTK1_5g09150 [Marchantia polymorpha subsp. ruderalis]|uniref:Uncharacterized protein n=2 Tax=Marchantia polymorpha TaxID=3197 RepID=A0AAF6BGH8_MARPO|nr:hypothetical protein MARPO_0095s0044 [Marchantia polymorpha]BBN11112.1 hypothetical protein Mp_5g09150 [Marchantia polymorpha subsp. ruderalis]|eukprot:PTQ32785.1 hypothetical protein MARPO_0095s0044 [Marchantia polymorpha]